MTRVVKGLAAILVASTLTLTAAVTSPSAASAAARQNQVVTIHADQSSVAIAATVTLSGTLTPATPDTIVKIQRRYAGKKKWATVAWSIVAADGTWSAALTMADARDRYYRAYVPKRKGFRADYSPKTRITVASDITRTETIPHGTIYTDDPTLPVGTSVIDRAGYNGTKKVTYRAGIPIKTVILREASDTLVSRGTHVRVQPTGEITTCEVRTSPTTGKTYAYVEAVTHDPDNVGYVPTLSVNGVSETYVLRYGDSAYHFALVNAIVAEDCTVTLS